MRNEDGRSNDNQLQNARDRKVALRSVRRHLQSAWKEIDKYKFAAYSPYEKVRIQQDDLELRICECPDVREPNP